MLHLLPWSLVGRELHPKTKETAGAPSSLGCHQAQALCHFGQGGLQGGARSNGYVCPTGLGLSLALSEGLHVSKLNKHLAVSQDLQVALAGSGGSREDPERVPALPHEGRGLLGKRACSAPPVSMAWRERLSSGSFPSENMISKSLLMLPFNPSFLLLKDSKKSSSHPSPSYSQSWLFPCQVVTRP